ncbi:MAG: hypothetical protein NHB32_31760 [Fischerella sp. CENA71]|nr:hypothetical protein [Fischerella sp. CENA71]
MLHIQEFGFAVELFVLLFCGICCFLYTPSQVQNNDKAIQEPESVEERFEEIPIEEPSLESIIETLSWAEAKSIVSELKQRKVTSVKLVGKGTGGTYFQEVIKTLLGNFEGDVRSVMKEVVSLR